MAASSIRRGARRHRFAERCAGTVDTSKLYDDIADVYHLAYADWPASIRRQAQILDGILRRELGDGPYRILDVSCGIGTQALGLAALKHDVTASDISSKAIERARSEAEQRSLDIDFSIADMRTCDRHHAGSFDAVIAADNSVPHLLSNDQILEAFRCFYRLTRPGGVSLITVRDYAREDRTTPQLRSYGVRTTPEGRYFVFQVWDFAGEIYDLAMYFVRETTEGAIDVRVTRGRYYAVDTDTLSSLFEQAGFTDVERIDGEFFQPVLLARRAMV
jgi:SAM-dependent methyltransferase